MSDNNNNNTSLPVLSRPVPTAKRVGWGLGFLYERIKSGEIESYVDGRARWIVNESVDRYIAKQLAKAKADREKVRE